MHEMGLARNIIAIVSEHAGTRPVRRVRVAIGPLACVEREALTFCFGVVAAETPLASAELTFVDAQKDELLIKDFELEELH
jgi:hydrogenase nickel incorporation protein HypA/HybF